MLITNVKANKQTITFFIASLLLGSWNPGQFSVSPLHYALGPQNGLFSVFGYVIQYLWPPSAEELPRINRDKGVESWNSLKLLLSWPLPIFIFLNPIAMSSVIGD